MDERVVSQLAEEIVAAYDGPHAITELPSGRGLDLATAYAVESAIVGMRRAAGHLPVGLKVGYANKAVWRALKLETLVWAHMYDDTVEHAEGGSASLDLSTMFAPKIEPEIVFKLKRPIGDTTSAAAILEDVEWLALGFEIIDCVFPDWKLQPVDFVVAKGLHARLLVGPPMSVTPDVIPALAEQLPMFTVKLLKDGAVAAEGSGRNSLRSPALALGELAAAMEKRGVAAMGPGALVSSGTLTESQPLGPGETWTATVEGLDLPDLVVQTRRG